MTYEKNTLRERRILMSTLPLQSKEGTGLVYTTLNESLNFREHRLYGFDAVQATLFQLFHTAMNSNPEAPSLGFDLHDFLFRSRYSEQMELLQNELTDKIQEVLRNESVGTTITRDGNTTNIEITYYRDGKEVKLPIAVDMDRQRLLFKNILIR